MTVSPIGQSPFPTQPPTIERAPAKPAEAPAPADDAVVVSGDGGGAIKEMLQAMIEQGFSVVAFNEDSARAAAEAVKAALIAEGRPIANADPATIGRRF
ncbi:MAG: hypothetical protein KDA49_10295 [Rhodospirillaceae bacterium]|nr:hypothetical protein [Rhodospirillaceae bacterium]MCA8932846.1 hypothetical protein [Rhodospirillaceae bacterium]